MDEQWQSDGSLGHTQHLLRVISQVLAVAADDLEKVSPPLTDAELVQVAEATNAIIAAVSGLVSLETVYPALQVLMRRG